VNTKNLNATKKIPVQPLLAELPLDELTEDRFEDFLTSLMGILFPTGKASRWGSRGHKQNGIDIIVVEKGKNIALGQCKRQKNFGPAAVEKAVKAVSIEADKKYLFLSRVASPKVREKINEYSGWELWDVNDISRFIQQTKYKDKAMRLVDIYFPGYRELFLGFSRPSPWRLPEEYFSPTYYNHENFNHNWRMVGREVEIERLVSFVKQDEKIISYVVGPGGIGKTKLLKEISSRLSDIVEIRILPGDSQCHDSDFELLPIEDDLLIIIDDAHDVSSIGSLLSNILHHKSNIKIIIATRPYKLSFLKETTSKYELDPLQISLEDLRFDEALSLAAEALNKTTSDRISRQLASLTTDCPLATVVGGNLIKKGDLDPAVLASDTNVRDCIMRGYHSALLNNAVDKDTQRGVLKLVAALQPVRTNQDDVRDTISKILGKPYDELFEHLKSLERVGIIRRRGDSLRIVPDLLGDFILADAVYDKDGRHDTGYIQRIMPVLAESCVENLLINMSRVDSQLRYQDKSIDLIDPILKEFRIRIEQADLVDRLRFVGILRKIGYFQPRCVLNITRWLIENPTDNFDISHESWRKIYPENYDAVLKEIPSAIKAAAVHEDTIEEAISQLWELSIYFSKLSPLKYSLPLQALCDLAKFEDGKPIRFNECIIDFFSEFFLNDQPLSPLDFLSSMFATEGYRFINAGGVFSFQPFILNPDSIMKTRQRVIDIAIDELGSCDLIRSSAAVKALIQAVKLPQSYFDKPVPLDELEKWIPNIVNTINRISERISTLDVDPFVLVELGKLLRRQRGSRSEEVCNAAKAAFLKIPKSPEYLFSLALRGEWRLISFDHDAYDLEANRTCLIDAIIDGFRTYTDEQLLDVILARIIVNQEIFGNSSCSACFWIEPLLDNRSNLVDVVLERLNSLTDVAGINHILPAVLSVYINRDLNAIIKIRQLFEYGDHERRRAVANALGWNRDCRDFRAGEMDLLLEISKDSDAEVRKNVVRAAQLVSCSGDRDSAVLILSSVRFSDDKDLADVFFKSFEQGICLNDFSDAVRAQIWQDAVMLLDVGGLFILSFFQRNSINGVSSLVRFFQDRIEYAEQLDSPNDYIVIPYSSRAESLFVDLVDDQYFSEVLSGILNWIAQKDESFLRHELGAKLFSSIADNYDDRVKEVLLEFLDFDDFLTVCVVGKVLSEAPRNFVLCHVDFVDSIFQKLSSRDTDIEDYDALFSGLFAAAVSGERIGGGPGEPFPQTVEIRDKSRIIACNSSFCDATRKFYRSLEDYAEGAIRDEIERHRPGDGRDW